MPQYYEHEDVWIEVPRPRPLKALIRSEILKALAYTDGQQDKAAKLLGVTPRVLGYQLRRYAVPVAQAGETRRKPGPKPKVSGSPARS